jgi:phosphoribosylformylglycinamidine synthase PurS subunit
MGAIKEFPSRDPKSSPKFRASFRASARVFMKAKLIITPKKAVLDPQGKTVQNALAHMGYTGVAGVHVGKYVEIDLVPGTDRAAAQRALDDAAHRFLSNPVIEDYRLEICDQ